MEVGSVCAASAESEKVLSETREFFELIFCGCVEQNNAVDKEVPAADAAGGWENGGVGTRSASVTLRKETPDMTKTLDVITEALSNTKTPFHKTDSRPKKAQKHRYERRKIKEYLHLGDWNAQEAV